MQAAVDFYGPTDVLQMDAHMISGPFFNAQFGLQDCHDDPKSPESLVGCAIQTCPEEAQAANPIRHVSRRDPPLAILHGTADRLVPHHQTQLLYAALEPTATPRCFLNLRRRPRAPLRHRPRRGDAPDRPPDAPRAREGDGRPARATWQTIQRLLRHALRSG